MNRKRTTPALALPSPTEQMMLGLIQQQAQLIAGQQLLLERLCDLLPLNRITIIYQRGNHNSANVESQVIA